MAYRYIRDKGLRASPDTIRSFKVLETESSHFLISTPYQKVTHRSSQNASDLTSAETMQEQSPISQNNGKLVFQHIDHVHFDVIPEKEALVMNIEQNWPQKKVEQAELLKARAYVND
ncbi:hypothetical protein AMATHDRAFT_49233 [Amanita thiersii Skay4041]|uniref:Uncharacterized protein n=1 Tax=Amanita thiersii Skay4041 TaxID=703135 RepID=A0A2A9NFF1_9AGAR|nr:hypothetical protein AMATHDRAFT_49233 [Amanita thiersii Skay4041]